MTKSRRRRGEEGGDISGKENDLTQGERLETLDEGASFVAAAVLSEPSRLQFSVTLENNATG